MSTLLLAGLIRDNKVMPAGTPAHQRITVADWTALAFAVDLDKPEDEAERALQWAETQHHLLTAYAQTDDVLPVAIGALFSSDDAVAAHLKNEATRFADSLARIRGCTEYILHMTGRAEAAVASVNENSGAAFLRARTQARDRRKSLRQNRHAFVSDTLSKLRVLCRACSVRDVAGKSLIADASLLVARAETPSLVNFLKESGPASDALGLVLKLIGPVPAYSFLEVGASGCPK